MTHWARPGVKCVCINGTNDAVSSAPRFMFNDDPVLVREGSVYTIMSVGTHSLTGELCIKLVDVPDRRGIDWGYNVSRFRPLITRTQEQDIELFTPLLDVHNHEELERVYI